MSEINNFEADKDEGKHKRARRAMVVMGEEAIVAKEDGARKFIWRERKANNDWNTLRNIYEVHRP